jgi:hypothetical protein
MRCSSIRMRISSGMVMAGCVSLSWMATFSAKFSSDGYATRWRRTMSCSEQATKKYCCFSRSSLPNTFTSLGVEDLGDGLRPVLVQHCLLVVALVEVAEVEVGAGPRAPEAQRVHRVAAVARDGGVVRHPHHPLAADPARAQMPAVVAVLLHVPAETHRNAVLRRGDLPGVA